MNCQRIQHNVLLGQSGELSVRQQRQVNLHVAACPACRAFAAEAALIVRGSRKPLDASPSEAVMNRILAAAKTRPAPVPAPRDWRRPAIAAAAGILVLLGLWHAAGWRQPASLTPGDRLARLSELSSFLTFLVSDDTASGEDVAPTEEIAEIPRQDTPSVARQLLILEGMSVENLTEECDGLTPIEERQPTTLRSHSNLEVPAERCG